MVKVKEDMTGWKMWERGVPDSRLIVIKQVEDYVSPNGHHTARYLCMCNCGSQKIFKVTAGNIRKGKVKSCGCLNGRAHSKHHLSHTKLYSVWNEMKQRCSNPNCPTYKDYGGRGISVCDEWKADFMAFREWALSLGYEDDAERGTYTVERIDNDGNYCPENCRLTTMKEQCQNRRHRVDSRFIVVNGESHTLSEWGRILHIHKTTLFGRLSKNKKIEDMIEYQEYIRQREEEANGKTTL